MTESVGGQRRLGLNNRFLLNADLLGGDRIALTNSGGFSKDIFHARNNTVAIGEVTDGTDPLRPGFAHQGLNRFGLIIANFDGESAVGLQDPHDLTG